MATDPTLSYTRVPRPGGSSDLRVMSMLPHSVPLKAHWESGYHRTVLWRTVEPSSEYSSMPQGRLVSTTLCSISA